VSLQEHLLEVLLIISCPLISDVIEELALFLQDLVFKSFSQQIVLVFIEYVNFSFRTFAL
jgi:hypothetical protein